MTDTRTFADGIVESEPPETRLDEQGQPTAKCRECGCALGAGYLCDDCDTIDFVGAKQSEGQDD